MNIDALPSQTVAYFEAISLKDWAITFGGLFVIFLLALFFKKMLCGFRLSSDNLYIWKKTINFASIAFSILFVSIVWIDDFGTLLGVLGIIGAGIIVALRDIIANFAGWIFIITKRSFTVGDRVQIGTYRGDVIDVGFFNFSMVEVGNWVNAEQTTGRILKVPNSFVLNQIIANYSTNFEYVWDEVPVVVTLESDWKRAKAILTEIANNLFTEEELKEAEEAFRETAHKYYFIYSKLTPIVYTKVVDYGVQLTIRYLAKNRNQRSVEEKIWEQILDAFAHETAINLAYPTRRVVRATNERYNEAHEEKTIPVVI